MNRVCRWHAIGVGLLVAGAACTNGQVVINEVMAANDSAVLNGNSYPDYVELFNTSTNWVSLGGWSLTDNSTQPLKFVFPTGTLIGPRSTYVVWCDSNTNDPGLHTGFGLKQKGDNVYLFRGPTNTPALTDQVVFGYQITNYTIARVPDGTGNWLLTQPSANKTNGPAVTLGSQGALVINEWLALDAVTNSLPWKTNDDWVEIYNPITNLPVALGGMVITDKTNASEVLAAPAIPNLVFIPPGGFIQFIADSKPQNGWDHLNFKISSTSGETISLFMPDKSTLVHRVYSPVYVWPNDNGKSFGCLPDGATNNIIKLLKATPEASNFQNYTNLVINEILTHTDPPLEDAVEFFNVTTNPVDISGFWLSNNRDIPKKYRIPQGTIVPPLGYKVFFEWVSGYSNNLGFNSLGTGDYPYFNFNSAHGDEVYLFTADAAGNLTGYRLGRTFGATANGVSLGRYVKSDGGTDLVPMSRRTFGVDNPLTVSQFRQSQGAPNAYPLVGPAVISEIHYHPVDIIQGTNIVDNDWDEFIELRNLTGTNLPLYNAAEPTNTWSVKGAVDFVFPTGAYISPNGVLLLVNFDPVTNTVQLAEFRNKFNVPSNVPIYGPYSHKLPNSTATIELYKPDWVQKPPHPDAGYVPQILVEKVKYEDKYPWPTNGVDGGGNSLHRLSLSGYANDQTNWFGAAPTPGWDDPPVLPPYFVEQPEDLHVVAGATVSFKAVALGLEPLRYQWYFNQAPLAGQTSTNLFLGQVQTNHTGDYYAVVSNQLGVATSAVASLLVVPPPQAAPPVKLDGGGFRLAINAVEGFSYQIQTSSNLLNWIPFGPVISNFTSPIVLEDTNPWVHRFFRGVVVP